MGCIFDMCILLAEFQILSVTHFPMGILPEHYSNVTVNINQAIINVITFQIEHKIAIVSLTGALG